MRGIMHMRAHTCNRLGKRARCAGLTIVLTTLLLSALLTASGPSQTADSQTIQKVVYGSQVAQQTLLQTPPAFRGGATIPESVMQQMKARIASGLRNFYTGDRLAQLTTVMQENANPLENGSTIEFGGGVSSITFTTIDIQGDHAEANGEVVKWLYGGQRDEKGVLRMSRPSGAIEFSDSLVRTRQGDWLIEAERDLPKGGV